MKRYFLFLTAIFYILPLFSQIEGNGEPIVTPLGNPLKPAKNAIIMIADGWSINHITMTNFYEGKYQIYQSDAFDFSAFMSTFPYGGSYDSTLACSDSLYVRIGSITDSAAAGTAMATGVKTYNGAININIDQETELTTSSQLAGESGRSTGVVSTTIFTDATPATFGGAHHVTRANGTLENDVEIAREMLFDTKLSVILSAGNPDYDYDGNEITDSVSGYEMGGYDLWQGIKDANYSLTSFDDQTVKDIDEDGNVDTWTVIHTKDDFLKAANGELLPKRLFGLADAKSVLQRYWGDGNTFEPSISLDKVPTLAEMSSAALNVLSQNHKGFYLMIEGANVDKASHAAANDPHRGIAVIREMSDFNRAVEKVVEWVNTYSNWEETLLIVTGDHETGYLTAPNDYEDLGINENNGKGVEPAYYFHSYTHTNQLIPVYAKGVNAERLTDYCSNVDIKRGKYLDNTDLSKLINAGFGVKTQPEKSNNITANQIWIESNKNQITIRSSSNNPIQMICAYNLNGSIIKKIEKLGVSYYSFTPDKRNQMLLLKVVTEKAVKNQKIFCL